MTRVARSVGVRVREGVARLTQADRVTEVVRGVSMVRVAKSVRVTRIF